MDIDSVVNEKLDADTDFQNSIANLSDEEKTSAIETKKKEILGAEFKSLKEKADQTDDYKGKFEDQQKRAKKAEEIAKEKEGGLSPKDVLVLSQAQIHADDIDEVLEFAKFKKLPVGEALKNPTLMTILAESKSQRETALATTTKGKPSSGEKGGDAILNDAGQGNLPADDEGIDALAAARHEARVAGRRK